MKIVVDTNVVMSGMFFGGPPAVILKAAHERKVELAVSLEILAEYERVAIELATKYPTAEPEPILSAIALAAGIVDCPPLPSQICGDPDDDKFLACAIAAGAKHIVSGDKQLLDVAEYCGVEVIRPRDFIENYLNS